MSIIILTSSITITILAIIFCPGHLVQVIQNGRKNIVNCSAIMWKEPSKTPQRRLNQKTCVFSWPCKKDQTALKMQDNFLVQELRTKLQLTFGCLVSPWNLDKRRQKYLRYHCGHFHFCASAISCSKRIKSRWNSLYPPCNKHPFSILVNYYIGLTIDPPTSNPRRGEPDKQWIWLPL